MASATSNVPKRLLRLLGWKSKAQLEPGHVPPLVSCEALQVHILGEIEPRHLSSLLMAIAVARVLRVPLRVWICSLGGDLTTAFAIHDALARASVAEVVGTGNVQSSALVAFLGAQRRYATRNTVFLRHSIEGVSEFPAQLDMSALKELAKCPEGFFDSITALAHGVVERVLETEEP